MEAYSWNIIVSTEKWQRQFGGKSSEKSNPAKWFANIN